MHEPSRLNRHTINDNSGKVCKPRQGIKQKHLLSMVLLLSCKTFLQLRTSKIKTWPTVPCQGNTNSCQRTNYQDVPILQELNVAKPLQSVFKQRRLTSDRAKH